MDLLSACLDPLWPRARRVWASGPVLDPYWLICGFLWTIGELLVGSLLDRIGFWVISSLGLQLELFVSLLCSEGLEWVVTLEISAGLIGWKFGWLEIGKNGRFTRFKSLRGRIVGSRGLPGGGVYPTALTRAAG